MDNTFRKYFNCIAAFSAMSVLVVALNSCVSAQDTKVGHSGVFDGLVVGIDSRNKTLSGFYSDGSGWDETTKSPTFTCAFFLKGTFQGGKYNIVTWYPGESESINGKLKFAVVDGQTKIRIKLEREHGGCGNVHPFAVDAGGMLSETRRGDWVAIRVISAEKAYFHSRPSLEAKRVQYVVRYNPIRVLQVQDDWVEAEFEAEKTTRGWIKASDLFASEPVKR